MPQAWEDQWSSEEVGLAIQQLRMRRGWKKARLAREAGIDEDLLDAYEAGLVLASRRTLERVAAAVDVPFERVERRLLPLMRPLRDALEGPSLGEELLAELDSSVIRASWAFSSMLRAVAMRLLAGSEMREATQPPFRPSAAATEDRLPIEGLWEELLAVPQENRRQAVEARKEFWRWALSTRCCEESLRAAADDADESVAWAELAVTIAAQIEGEERSRQRLLGWATFHLGNAYRVHGDLTPADLAFAKAQSHWEAGEGDDPHDILNPAQVLGMESSLRRAQRRFSQALSVTERALVIDQGELRPQLLMNKAKIFLETGEYEQALAALAEARPLLPSQSEPRLARLVETNYALMLCQLERYREAEYLLPQVREMTLNSGAELDQVRFQWLQGKVAAGLGRTEEALGELVAVKEEFARLRIPFDAALVTLEIAALELQEGRTAEVKRLACEMVTIFKAQKVHREAIAAVQLFREAADREAVTQEAIRELLAYLQRARSELGLRFGEGAGAG